MPRPRRAVHFPSRARWISTLSLDKEQWNHDVGCAVQRDEKNRAYVKHSQTHDHAGYHEAGNKVLEHERLLTVRPRSTPS